MKKRAVPITAKATATHATTRVKEEGDGGTPFAGDEGRSGRLIDAESRAARRDALSSDGMAVVVSARDLKVTRRCRRDE